MLNVCFNLRYRYRKPNSSIKKTLYHFCVIITNTKFCCIPVPGYLNTEDKFSRDPFLCYFTAYQKNRLADSWEKKAGMS